MNPPWCFIVVSSPPVTLRAKGLSVGGQVRDFPEAVQEATGGLGREPVPVSADHVPLHAPHIRVRIECDLKLLRVDFPLLIQNMRINFCNHRRLRMAGIPLRGLNVTMIELQLIGGA